MGFVSSQQCGTIVLFTLYHVRPLVHSSDLALFALQSGKSVEVTMWGETAESMNEERLPAGVVVVIKAAKVSEYQGRSLNASFGSQILVNPDRPEARELLEWATQVRPILFCIRIEAYL